MRYSLESICHLAFWFVATFATPLFIVVNNSADMALSVPMMALLLLAAMFAALALSLGLGRLLRPGGRAALAYLLLGLAFVLALQGNLVHELFYYGNFSGERVDFRSHGRPFWIEWFGFIAALLLVPALLLKFRPRSAWIALLPIISSLMLLLPALAGSPPGALEFKGETAVEDDVFRFSTRGNVIHLLPDGFQSDIAQQVLEEHPDLAAQFEGFSFFANHLGLYQGTAPAVATIFTGEPFPLERGHNHDWVIPFIHEEGYPTRLKAAGYRLDMVPISAAYCPESADSCHQRPFNDLKPRGYFRHHHDGLVYSLRLLADLSLFRLMPMWLKEKIYNDGHWLLSNTTMDGSSPWPDPVLREWISNMQVSDGPPVYKWYHYIGSHIPPLWDAECVYRRGLDRSRENFFAQTRCILRGIADLIQALKRHGVYEQTAIVVTGDHGCAVPPADYIENRPYLALLPGLVGSSRPVFMVKPAGTTGALRFDQAPTALTDIEPTVLRLAGLEDETEGGGSVAFELDASVPRLRYYMPYSNRDLWGNDPVPHEVHRVDGDVRDGANWKVADLFPFRSAPDRYAPVNFTSAGDFMRGARLGTDNDNEASWVNGNQLAFLISAPGGADVPHILRLVVHQPEWLAEQRADVYVNGQLAERGLEIRMNKGFWTEIGIAVSPDMLRKGNNFVSVEFSETAHPPNIDSWEAASLVRSIWLAPAPG